MKTRVVVFTKNNARIFINPPDEYLAFFKTLPNAIINPDLSSISGFGPESWKLEKGKIVVKNAAERQGTWHDIAVNGADNEVKLVPMGWKHKTKFYGYFALGKTKKYLVAFILGAGACYLAGLVYHL